MGNPLRRKSTAPEPQPRPEPRDEMERAEQLVDWWEAERKEAQEWGKTYNRFRGACTPRQVIEMWKNGVNEKGKRLTRGEVEVLVERWVELFGTLPPSKPVEPKPPAEPMPEDDTMLDINDVMRLTGISKSSINRDYRRKPPTFPPPTHRVGVGNHGKRWKAGVVKAWLAEREWEALIVFDHSTPIGSKTKSRQSQAILPGGPPSRGSALKMDGMC